MTPDEQLAAAIEHDNAREATGMHGDDRRTCWTHQGWASDCENDPLHTSPGAARHYRPA
ncbi:hypothetical protein AB0395_44800 [Streptosporangium sp. NPDC051023]|uniref:hypothetical protein n=1 Tax=Streptosporangium sp. NPDC051023 TaxID=3155410 RepID=UPI00344FD4C7